MRISCWRNRCLVSLSCAGAQPVLTQRRQACGGVPCFGRIGSVPVGFPEQVEAMCQAGRHAGQHPQPHLHPNPQPPCPCPPMHQYPVAQWSCGSLPQFCLLPSGHSPRPRTPPVALLLSSAGPPAAACVPDGVISESCDSQCEPMGSVDNGAVEGQSRRLQVGWQRSDQVKWQ